MNIVKAKENELKSILDLQFLAYQSEAKLYDDFTMPPLHQSLSEITECLKKGKILVAKIDNNIVGSVRASINNNKCEIACLIVHPNYQGKGIGTALLNEIEKQFNASEVFELFTGHKSFNNISLYTKFGYRKTKKVIANKKITLVYLQKANYK